MVISSRKAMKKTIPVFLPVILLMNLPSICSANAGTPLMWASAFHLVIGNIIIGIIEGSIVARALKVGYGKAIILLILANYFSAWFGGVFLLGIISRHLHPDLYNFKVILAATVLVAYILSLVTEWPFVALCCRRTAGWMRRSIYANFRAQSLTYLLLLIWYGLASGTSLLTGAHIVPVTEFRFPEEIYCYYISSDSGDVYSRNLTTSREEKIFDLKSTNDNDRLFTRPKNDNSGQLEIVALLTGNDRRHPSFTTVQYVDGSGPEDTRRKGDQPGQNDTWFNFGEAPRLGNVPSGRWVVHTGFWAVDGIYGKNGETGQEFHFSLETPFLNWQIRNAVHFPQDIILFQLGGDQICVLEVETGKMALVARGRGPVAVMVRVGGQVS